MHERSFRGSNFTLPKRRPMSSTCDRCYPFSCAHGLNMQRLYDESPYYGFDEYPRSSQCRCLDCQQRNLQRQMKYNSEEQRRAYYNGNKTSGTQREIPIKIVKEGEQMQDAGFDSTQEITARKSRVKGKKHSKIGHTRNVCSVDDSVGETSLPGRTVSLEARKDHKYSQLPLDVDIGNEKADKSEDDSIQNAEMTAQPTTAEKLQDIDEEVKHMKLGKISNILVEAQRLAEGVSNFQGKEKNKDYLYLEEMLMTCLLSLDEILTDGVLEIRKRRKEVATIINDELKRLEDKLKAELLANEIPKSEEKSMDDITLSSDRDLLEDLNCEGNAKESIEPGCSLLNSKSRKDASLNEREAECLETMEAENEVKNEELNSDRKQSEKLELETNYSSIKNC